MFATIGELVSVGLVFAHWLDALQYTRRKANSPRSFFGLLIAQYTLRSTLPILANPKGI